MQFRTGADSRRGVRLQAMSTHGVQSLEQPQERDNVVRLKKLYELSMTLSGDPVQVFAQIAPMIGEFLDVPIVCLSAIRGPELQFLSVYNRGEVTSNAGCCSLAVTPCATVARDKSIQVYDRVAERFPDASFLADHKALSYCGFPSIDSNGEVVAVTCLLDDRPREFTPEDQELLLVFGQRIAMEIERERFAEERDWAELALDQAEAKFRDIYDNADEGLFQSTPDGRFISANPTLARMLGYGTPSELIESVTDIGAQLFLNAEEREACLADLEAHDRIRGKEVRWRRKDGSVVWLSESAHAVRTSGGAILYFQGTVVDITDRKAAEDALRTSEARLAGILDIAQEAVVSVDAAQKIQIFNKGAERIFGYTAEEVMGRSLDILMPDRFRAGHQRYIDGFARAPEVSRLMNRRGEIVGLRKSGEEFPAEASVSKLDIGRQVTYSIMLRDITDRKMTEDALRDSEERFRSFAETSSDWLWETDENLRYIYFSGSFERAGMGIDQRLGKTREETTAEDSSLPKWQRHRADILARKVFRNFEHATQAQDGRLVQVSINGTPFYDAAGAFKGYRGTGTDITQRRTVEDQLRQAQKMEAVGQLTGGVAHDFNNLLAVIMGHAELLQDRLGEDDPSASAVARAAARGAELTQRLLAFSRRQTLAPEAIDPEALVTGMMDLLRRTLGETIEIELTTEPQSWRTLADPGQLENALLNLAINARDAMPEGGKLVVGITNTTVDGTNAALYGDVVLGDYVELGVRDSGVGMEPEVMAHAFEPFYTTKDVGSGSGLGLPMVYGFVRQTGGFVTLDSEPERGTIVKLFLPRVNIATEEVREDRAGDAPQGRGESILVIEDDPEVRELARSMLKNLGYQVFEAEDGEAALAILKAKNGIDLLLADVVLSGGISGPCLVDEAKRDRPDLKIIYMSGHIDKVVESGHSPCRADAVFEKPFRKRDLAQKVRAVLDGSTR